MMERLALCLRNLGRHGWRTRIIVFIAFFGAFLTFVFENLVEDIAVKQSDMFARGTAGHFRIVHRDVETRNSFGYYYCEPRGLPEPRADRLAQGLPGRPAGGERLRGADRVLRRAVRGPGRGARLRGHGHGPGALRPQLHGPVLRPGPAGGPRPGGRLRGLLVRLRGEQDRGGGLLLRDAPAQPRRRLRGPPGHRPGRHRLQEPAPGEHGLRRAVLRPGGLPLHGRLQPSLGHRGDRLPEGRPQRESGPGPPAGLPGRAAPRPAGRLLAVLRADLRGDRAGLLRGPEVRGSGAAGHLHPAGGQAHLLRRAGALRGNRHHAGHRLQPRGHRVPVHPGGFPGHRRRGARRLRGRRGADRRAAPHRHSPTP